MFCYVAVVAVMYLFQRHLMYQPRHDIIQPSQNGVKTFSIITLLNSDDQLLESWFVKPPLAKKEPKVLVYFHGNAGHIGDREAKVQAYINEGIGVLLVGFRGYGRNPGSPSELGFYEDAKTALRFLDDLGFTPLNLVLYGESLGTGVAVEVARKYNIAGTPVAAVVLEAPFTSMGDAAQEHYPFIPAKLLVRDKYNSIDKIAQLGAPLMIVHGTSDQVVPIHHGQTLFTAAQEPKYFEAINDASHNNLYEFGVATLILRFINNQ
ncbi:MAG: hypothetical protein CBB68_11525 [Rhodospirillaceae bacterium TMED8]|nr:hypothetical protein [Magnetovibrio sp.]OUT49625.1 MAG: hypothetical protein CBB68_11525 [Rhodospirillaceae bacterium TMED8]|tara:strand:+ start:1537 stop:2328 length:792 start_codon:yes stop_codon:yes gene_type:complete